ncbi:MAG: hypothetical protein JWP55_2231, partial [Mycobacterium sp.]|nr:hypothetical protein [Mycobacterium sp.]
MGYPDNVLAADERVVLHRHPHWKRLIGPVLILLLVTALAAFGAAVVNHTDWGATAKNVVMAVIGVLWLVVFGWLVLCPFLNWRTTHFVITDNVGKDYAETCVSHYRPFWSAGVNVDVIPADAPLDRYRLVIAPMLYMIRPGVAEAIERFVANGGTFVTTYMSGIANESDLF